jgi:NAD(P)-dependent dehydrogenase (short-subunit alcohol dehydrogenase family)
VTTDSTTSAEIDRTTGSNATTFDYGGAHVLVTGGSNGIGLGIARAFAAAGAAVTITGTRSAAGEYDHDLTPFAYRQCSLTDKEQIAALAASFGSLDVLVNNAGQVMPGGRFEYEPDVFEEALQINVAAAFRLTQLLRPTLAASALDGGASVINMASLSSFFAVEFVPGYGAAKAAVVQMTKTLAVNAAKEGIRVNAIAPGLIESNMTAPMLPHEAMTKPHIDRTPARRVGTPDDIWPAVLFLCSSGARYITGQTLLVDGGFSVTG